MAKTETTTKLLARYGRLSSQRANWENHWQEVADYMMPRKANITKKKSNVAINRLENARRMYVKNTGGKLKDVTTSKGYQRLSELAKKEYKKRNPQDFEEEKKGFKLGKRSLLGA